MRHFSHHIGDYAAATAHLSMLEDAAYHRALRRYYQDERALPADVAEVQRLIGARSRAEKAAVENILREFFTLEVDGWHQVRADGEILNFKNKSELARLNGAKGGRPPRAISSNNNVLDNQDGSSEESQSVPGAKLPTTHEPRTNTQKKTREARTTKRGTALPADWKATAEQLAYAKEQGCVDPADTAERFRLHHLNKGTIGKDWNLGFQYWCRNEKNFARKPAQSFAQQREQVAVTVANRDGDGQWRQRVKAYRPGAKWWLRNDWGPPPGEPGCRVPAHILAEVGTP